MPNDKTTAQATFLRDSINKVLHSIQPESVKKLKEKYEENIPNLYRVVLDFVHSLSEDNVNEILKRDDVPALLKSLNDKTFSIINRKTPMYDLILHDMVLLVLYIESANRELEQSSELLQKKSKELKSLINNNDQEKIKKFLQENQQRLADKINNLENIENIDHIIESACGIFKKIDDELYHEASKQKPEKVQTMKLLLAPGKLVLFQINDFKLCMDVTLTTDLQSNHSTALREPTECIHTESHQQSSSTSASSHASAVNQQRKDNSSTYRDL